MAKQLNVSLAFTADTSQAKSQIQSLQTQLDSLTKNAFANSNSLGLTKEIKEATGLVAQLKTQLQNATNSSGTLDLSRFNDSLKKSQTSIADYKNALIKLGPEGSQAFANLASSITSAEIPLRRSNALVKEFATSLANTARWQLSSSVLHGFMSTMQSAYSYAQNLDKSLTDIQIVTGNNADYMAKFADKANEAAQALSTTTKQYSDASLIFFQQGLSEDEVLKRTDTTIKMAQATGDSVDQVSSYMTAIWNNFYDGSESLEHYADIITKLGAATASSSSEIAEGIQQFAGIGKTIGLSYDYATAALTTLTANTRQSASEIGNSLKTIFSRFQGVKLGDTLEDGVDLNKYSNALRKIGVDIIDVNGEMKDMDNILDETASRWDGLTRAQKMAFAETAAGTMQYTKLVSLMDNWDDMQKNLDFAKNSDGTLEEQAEIYADSWEGARKRVRAAAESIYNDLLDENFFKTFDNFLAKMLQGIDGVIDGLGGLPGVLSLVGAALTKTFSNQIVANIENLAYTLKMKTKAGREEVQARRAEANEALKDKMVTNTDTGTGQAQATAYSTQAKLQQVMIDNAAKLNSEEQKHAQLLLDISNAQGQNAIEAGKALDIEKSKTEELKKNIALQVSAAGKRYQKNADGTTKTDENGTALVVGTDQIKNMKSVATELENMVVETEKLKTLSTQLDGIMRSGDNQAEKTEQARAALQSYNEVVQSSTQITQAAKDQFKNMITALSEGDITSRNFTDALDVFRSELEITSAGGDDLMKKVTQLNAVLLTCGFTQKEAAEYSSMLLTQFGAEGNKAAELMEKLLALANGADFAGKKLSEMGKKSASGAQIFTSLSMSVMSTYSVITTFKSTLDAVKDGTFGFSNAMSIAMSAMMVMNSVTSVANALEQTHIVTLIAEKVAIEGVTASYLVAAGAIGLIVGAIALITIGIKALINSMKDTASIEAKLRAAKEATEDQKQALDDAKQSAEDLKSSFDTYDSVVQTLQDCTKGTDDWNEALQGVNQSVLEILSQYPELASMVNDAGEKAIGRNEETGALEIAPWAREEITRQENQKIIDNQAAYNQASQTQRNFEVEKQREDINNNAYKTVSDVMSGSNISDKFDWSNLTGLNTFLQNIDWSKFAGLTDVADILSEVRTQLDAENKKLQKEGQESGIYQDQFNGLDIETDNGQTVGEIMANAILSSGLSADLNELDTTIQNNNAITETENQAVADMIIANNEDLRNSKNGQMLAESGGKVYQTLYEDAMNKAVDTLKEGTDQQADALMKSFAEAKKLTDDTNFKYERNKDGGYDVTTTDPNDSSKTVETTYTAEQIAAITAATDATEAFTKSLEALSDKITELESKTNKDGSEKSESQQKSDGAMASFLASQDLLGATQSEIKALQEQINSAQSKDGKVSGMGAFIDNVFGDGEDGKISTETAKKYGYTTGEEMIKALEEALTNQSAAWDDVGKNWMQKVKDAMTSEDLDLSDLSVKTKQALGDALEKAYETSGSEGLESAKKIFQDLKPEEVESFAGALDDIDFNDTTPKQFAAALDEAGVETNFTTEELQAFIDAMTGAGNAAMDLTSKYAQNKSVIDKLSDGDTISADDFDKLDAAYQDYFVKTLDGTYKLVGAAEDLQKAVKDDYIKAFQSQNDSLREQNKGYQAALDSGNTEQLAKVGGANGNDNQIYQQQLELLTAIGDQTVVNKGQLEDWDKDLKDLSPDEIKAVQEALDATGISEQSFTDAIAANEAQIHETDIAILNSCETLSELQQRAQEIGNSGDMISWQEYGQVLQGIASQYDNTSDELEKLKQAQSEYNAEIERSKDLSEEEAEQVKQVQDAKMAAIMAQVEMATIAGEAANTYGIDADVIEAFIEQVANMDSYVDATTDDVAKLGVAYARANEGLNDLCDNADKYNEVLKEIADNGYAQAITKDTKNTKAFENSLANLLNTSNDTAKALLSNQKNSDLLSDALKGNAAAIKALDKEARKVSAIEIGVDVDNITGGEEALDSLLDQIDEMPEGKEIEVAIYGDDEAENVLQNLMQELWDSSSSLDDFQNYLSQLDLFGDVVADTEANVNAIVGTVENAADAMNQAGYVWVSNANGITDGLVNALQLETDVGSETDTVSTEGQTETPTPFHPVENGSYEVHLPGGSFSQQDGGKSFTFTQNEGTTLKYTGVGWESGNAETQTSKEETPVTGVWVRPRKGGGAGTATHTNRNVNGGGGGGGRGGRGGGGRRGGGGGRAARRNSEQKKQKVSGSDRYHKLDKQLTTLNNQYDKVSKAKDRAYGKSKLKLMDQEIKAQDKIIAKQKEYLAAAKKNLDIDKKRLQNGKTKYTDSDGKEQTVASGAKNYLGMEAKFDSDGNISNYAALMEAARKKYNAAVVEFNKHTTDDESAKKAMEAAKQQYDGFVAWLEQYEETKELVDEKAQEVIDAQNEAYDKRFEKTEYMIDIKVEVEDSELEYLEYMLNKLEDNAHDAASAISLIGDEVENSKARIGTLRDGLNNIFNNGNHPNLQGQGNLVDRLMAGDQSAIELLAKEDFTEEEMKKIQSMMSDLQAENEKMLQYRKDVFDRMNNAFQDNIDKMDTIINRSKHLQTITQSYANIVDLVGKKTAGITSDLINDLGQTQVKAAVDTLAESRLKMETIQAQLQESKDKRDKAAAQGLTEDVKLWDETIKQQQEALDSAQEDFLSNWETALQAAKDAFDKSVTSLVDDFSTKVGGMAGSIAALQEKWDQSKTLEEEYVPQYEKIYQLTKLTRDINKSIDETKNIKAKRELASLQEEINGLQAEGKKMSEYDLEYLQKRYELKIAEMALEDAQNAKSQVRMTKDSEGNFSYVYTADEQQVAEAEQSYEDKLHEMQQMNAEYINTLQENMIKMEQEQAEKIAQLSELYEVGSAEYQAELLKLRDYYGQQMTYYSGQMENVLNNNTDLYENDVKNYAALTDNKAMADEKYVGSFSQTQLAIQTGYSTMTTLQQQWKSAAETMYKEVGTAATTFKNNNEAAMNAAGTSVTNFRKTVSDELGKIKKESSDMEGKMKEVTKLVKTEFQAVVSAVTKFENKYSKTIDTMVAKNDALRKSFEKLLRKYTDFQIAAGDGSGSDDNNTPTTPTTPTTPKKPTKDNSSKAEGVAAAIWIWGDHSGWGDNPERARKLKEKGVSNAQAIINAKAENGWLYNKYWDKRFEIRNKYSYGKFDTGGYTGDWAGDGKFAMLHQKEIVLNKEDTENFLKSVDIVRQIANTIDLNAMSASGGLGSLFAASVNKDNDVLEQNVHITAEFPNVTDKNEIISAFDNVVNLASQYANRKR